MFNAKKTKEDLIKWIYKWYCKNSPDHNHRIVIGMSGGKDSTIMLALLCEALGNTKIIPVMLPQGPNYSFKIPFEICRHFNIIPYKYDIDNAVAAIYGDMISDFENTEFPGPNNQTASNLPARIRMAYLYAVASCVNGFVVNNSNLSEDYIGWTTKGGSAVGDFAPFNKLTCTEVIKIGEALGLPDKWIKIPPADGLQAKTDEEAFGFTYKELDSVIRKEYHWVHPSSSDKIKRMHKNSRHKFRPMPSFPYKE